MKRALCVMAAAISLAACSGSGEPEVDEPADAYRVCENWVEKQLRAPATADFSGRDGSEVEQVGAGYRVIGHVDSENGFGAQVRSDFTCITRLTGDTWELLSLNIEP